MIRTQIQLPEHEYEDLRAIAHRLNRSMADCVREAVAEYLTRSRPADQLMSVAGKFTPQPTDALKDHDQWWADTIVASKSKP